MTRAQRIALVALLLVAGAALWLLRTDGEAPTPVSGAGRAAPESESRPLLEGVAPSPAEKADEPAVPRTPEDSNVPKAGGATDTVVIEGTVTGWDGKPAAGKAVFLVLADDPAPPRVKGGTWEIHEVTPDATTDAEGRYEARTKRGWGGVVVARASDTFEARSATVQATEARQRVDLVMPAPATLRVRLTAKDLTGHRIKQLDVTGEFVWFAVGRHDEPESGTVEWEDEGRAATVRTVAGPVKVRVWLEGRPAVEGQVMLVSGEVTTLTLEVAGEGVVRGRVLWPEAWHLIHLDVRWIGADGEALWDAELDGQGGFRFVGVGTKPGSVHVTALVDEFRPAEARLDGVVPDGPPVVLTLERRIPSIVVGTLMGHPAEGAVRGMRLSRGETGGLTLSVDATGRFELELVSREPALLVISVPGMAPTCVDLPLLAPGERRDLGTLRVGAGRDVSGRVLTADRAPVAGVEVAAADRWAVETDVPAVSTDAHGAFRLPHLPACPCWLRFRGGGFPQHLVHVGADVSDGLDVVVTPGGIVRVRVVDGAGLTVAGSYVSVLPGQDLAYDADFDSTRFAGEVGTQGSVELKMCVGPRRLRAFSKAGAHSEEARVHVREGETTEVTLVLREKPAK